jgi:hypothetical protein
MAAAVLARAAMRDRGRTPGRREDLEALATQLADLAADLEDTLRWRPSRP